MIDPTHPTTWHWKSSLAVWRFEAPSPSRSDTPTTLAQTARRCSEALLDFGAVARIEWDVASLPTADACTIADRDTALQCLSRLEAIQGLSTIRCQLDLTCVDTDGVASPLRHAATLWFDTDTDEPDTVFVQLRLHVDIYAPLTWGPARDNAALASLNGPRLSGFLHRLTNDVGLTMTEVDASAYPKTACDHGFRADGAVEGP